ELKRRGSIGKEVSKSVEPEHAIRIRGQQKIGINPFKRESRLDGMLPDIPNGLIVYLRRRKPVGTERLAIQAASEVCKSGDLNNRCVQASRDTERQIGPEWILARRCVKTPGNHAIHTNTHCVRKLRSEDVRLFEHGYLSSCFVAVQHNIERIGLSR